jgi:predicted nuclease of predicted toxin-antitoxin system
MFELRFLLDQDVSPSHVARLSALGCYAEAVAHVGLAGSTDESLMAHCLERSLIIITKNPDDFMRLAKRTSLHPGMVLLRDGMLRIHEEWAWIEPVVMHLATRRLDPVNTVIDVRGVNVVDVLRVP